MVVIQVCVGSSCHLKGAPKLVEMLEACVKSNKLEEKVTLCGSFCAGKCNRVGVTISVNGTLYPGITIENFYEFWNEKVMPIVRNN